MIEVKRTKRFGRGIYATRNIAKGNVLFEDHVLQLKPEEMRMIDVTELGWYQFEWGKGSAIALGKGSLFNHDDDYNVDYVLKFQKKLIKFVTNRAIMKGEQLFINYGYHPLEAKKRQNDWEAGVRSTERLSGAS